MRERSIDGRYLKLLCRLLTIFPVLSNVSVRPTPIWR